MLCGANHMAPDPRILKWCHFPTYILVGEIRGVQMLPDCIGDRARDSKEQAWMSQCGFCMK